MNFPHIRSIGAYVLVALALLLGRDATACSPYSALTVNWQVVGTQLQINFTSNTGWQCCYVTRVELRCAAANFSGVYTHNTAQLCMGSGSGGGWNTPGPYAQLNIDLSSYCPGTQLKFRARETRGGGGGPITPTYNFTVPGILSPLTASATANPPNVCIGGCSTLTAGSANACGNVSYSWSSGGTGLTESVCPATPTAYTVTATDPGDACSGPRTATATVNVGVDPDPVAGTALVQPTAVCVGENVNLSLIGSVGDVVWQSSPDGLPPWTDIGGATTVTYAFQNLTATTSFRAVVSNACQSEISNVVTAIAWPLPAVDFSFTTPCDGTAAEFTDLSENTVTAWQWDFGDNSGTSAQQSPSYTYGVFNTYSVTLTAADGNGCSDQSTQQVLVRPQPVADFTFVSVCNQLATVFTDATQLGAGNIATWDWDFDSQAVATVADPSFTFNGDGTFNVTLSVVSDLGCADDVTLPVVVYPVPVAQFGWTDVCEGLASSFTDLTTVAVPGQVNSWQWDFGDLIGTSIQSTPNYTFGQTDIYSVTLSVVTADGCTDQITDQVEVFPIPVSDFTFSDVCQFALVTFQNTSTVATGVINVNLWDFGNGTSNMEQPPVHSYDVDGTYQISLTVETGSGCSNTSTQQIVIFPKPVAAFAVSNVCADVPIPIQNLSTLAAPGQMATTVWNMGDFNILTDTIFSTYQYGSYGDYTIQLALETQNQCQDTAEIIVSVHPMPVAAFGFSNICETDSIRYVDQSTVAQGDIVNWQWNFGNNNTDATQNPDFQHYAADDFYPVQLTVTTDSGCVNMVENIIEIYPTPIAAITFDSVCFPLPVQFSDISDANGAYAIDQWAWTFTEGPGSTEQLPLVAFNQYGAYGATLTITNAAGCKDVVTAGNALVHPLPLPDFDANWGHCLLDSLRFTDQSTVPLLSDDENVSWIYTLGDGSIISEPNGQYNYALPGFYPVQLLVTTNNGCQDSLTRTVEVFPLPQVDMQALPSDGCAPLQVQFFDASTIPEPYSLMGWQWDLGDSLAGGPAVQNPYFLYAPEITDPNDSATYNISLIVTSGNGCVDSVLYEDFVVVHPLPNARFSTDPGKVANSIDPTFTITDLSTENVVDWQWFFGDGATSEEQHPEHTYQDTGFYLIEQFVETVFGCADTITYTVKVEPYFTFYIPNAFTPDEDDVNELFFGSGEYILEYNMQIHDRWGELLFESNDVELKWDGSYRGKQVESGQYIYSFNIVDALKVSHRYVGSVMLMR